MAFNSNWLVDPNKSVLAKGELLGADLRYRYVPYNKLGAALQQRLRESGAYPHSTPGIPPEAYAYPIGNDGKLANARRGLMWTYAYTKKMTSAPAKLKKAIKSKQAATKKKAKFVPSFFDGERESRRNYEASQNWYHSTVYRAAVDLTTQVLAERGSGREFRLYYKTGGLRFFPSAPGGDWKPTDLVESGWHTEPQVISAITKIAGRLSLYPTKQEYKAECFNHNFNVVCKHKHS